MVWLLKYIFLACLTQKSKNSRDMFWLLKYIFLACLTQKSQNLFHKFVMLCILHVCLTMHFFAIKSYKNDWNLILFTIVV